MLDIDKDKKTKTSQEWVAKKDFLIVQNDFRLEIKKGDTLKGLPQRFIVNLKTEGVI